MTRKGFSIIEALAALVLITLIMSFSFLILVQARKNTRMNQDYLIASQVSVMISNYISAYMQNESNFSSLESFLGSNNQRTLDETSCNQFFDHNYCDLLFGMNINQKTYDDSILVIYVFQKNNNMIRFEINVIYYESKTTTIEVYIHE